MRRRSFLLASTTFLFGCASSGFKPLSFPPNVVLQDAPAGMAVVYLIRAPHDRATIPVYFDERKLAVLPALTYTAVVVMPSTFAIASAPGGGTAEAPASTLTVGAGERRFLYVSAPTNRSLDLIAVPMGKTGIIPLLLPTYVAAGARTWKECSELDAQGLMSLGKLVLPEPGAA